MSRTLTGTVVNNAMDKTVKVAVKRSVRHPLYKKQYVVTKTYLAHDQDNTCEIGQMVTLSESNPISKRKRWTVVSQESAE